MKAIALKFAAAALLLATGTAAAEPVRIGVGSFNLNNLPFPLAEGLGYYNETMDKKALNSLVGECYRLLGSEKTVTFLDRLKDVGFQYATRAGITIGIDDLHVPAEKRAIIDRAADEVRKILQDYADGVITGGERYNRVIDTWTNATNSISEILFQHLGGDRGGFNPIYMMANSGSRGSKEQIVFLRADEKELLRDCYNRIMEQRHGLMEKPDIELKNLFNNAANRIVAYKREGRVRGYMVFGFKPGEQDNFLVNDIVVRELFYESREALAGLFGFLHRQADQLHRVAEGGVGRVRLPVGVGDERDGRVEREVLAGRGQAE